MAFLSDIIDGINSSLKDKLTAFPTAKYFGLVYQLAKKEGNKTIYLPADINLNGQAEYATFDDINELGIYHRVSNSTYQISRRESYGDTNSGVLQIYDVDLVVMANRKRVEVQPDVLEIVIVSNFMETFKLQGVNQISITPVSANHNSKSVFSNEFQGLNYYLKPEHILFSIRYRIELRYQRGCISLCHCEETV